MMEQREIIIGIDLGTTNSEVAAFKENRISVLGQGERKMLPSCVGLSETGELLVGGTARNQQMLYPERTVHSVKRLMGSAEKVTLGEKEFTPQEISAFILRTLASWAEQNLGSPVKKAVITVPAYFSDTQRQATREAGALAGLEVLRIINEPTAASLAYGYGREEKQTIMVYDLGGGTFDVSIVTIEQDITEVRASHGNNRLGGNDFTECIIRHLVEEFHGKHGMELDPSRHKAAYSRLWWAAEEAKKKLTETFYTTIREEALLTVDGKPLNLEVKLSRDAYEDMIRPLAESTLESVSKAMGEADIRPADLDAVVLVGGATRTPFIQTMLEERAGLPPHQEIHPDLCVALGAGVLAGRLSGDDIDHILVDVSPYSFGISYLGLRNGMEMPDCYHPIIKRNLPLPVTRSEQYSTSVPYQKQVLIKVYQGESAHALDNTLVGEFKVVGLSSVFEPNELLCNMKLDLDGILHVEAVETKTGKSKKVLIKNALGEKTVSSIEKARERVSEIFATRTGDGGEVSASEEKGESIIITPSSEKPGETAVEPAAEAESEAEGEAAPEAGPESASPVTEADAASSPATWEEFEKEAEALVDRAHTLFDSMHPDDKEEALQLKHKIIESTAQKNRGQFSRNMDALKELLFFVEGS